MFHLATHRYLCCLGHVSVPGKCYQCCSFRPVSNLTKSTPPFYVAKDWINMFDMALCKETVFSCSSAMIPKSSLCLSLCSVTCLSWLLNTFWLKMWLIFFLSRCRALLTCIKSILHASLSSIQVALPVSVLCLSYWLLLLMLTHFTLTFSFFALCLWRYQLQLNWINE